MSPPTPIRACIFDMDGLLLNTEDLITDCINIILRKYHKPDLPWSLKARIQGRSAKDSNAILLEWANLPVTTEEFTLQVSKLHEEIFPTSEPLPGVEKLLEELQRKPAEMALATSSSQLKFAIKTVRHTKLFTCFPPECRVLGDDARVALHKPAPDIYLRALQCINEKPPAKSKSTATPSIKASECLIFEDSIQGVEAGRKAGMQVVWCPHPMLLKELMHGEGDDVRCGLCQAFGLSDGWFMRGVDNETLADQISKATDGWITLLLTLEAFPFTLFGL